MTDISKKATKTHMNPHLKNLHAYPFEKLRQLLRDVTVNDPKQTIALSIGEPQHSLPSFVEPVLQTSWQNLNRYPTSKGSEALRCAIAQWQNQRAGLKQSPLDPDTQVLPVSGTREALFSFAQAILDSSQKNRAVGMPNPFYQIYEGAAIMAGCEPFYINCVAESAYQPDFDALSDGDWDALQMLYICNPHNPTGATFALETLCMLVEKAQKHDFILVGDECYSEIYLDATHAPISLLTACAHLGLNNYKNCVVLNSLSKRSSLAGLRSGFVAGDAEILSQYLRYRTYHGCTLSPIAEQISIAAWSDETHVVENRAKYQEKLTSAYAALAPLANLPKPVGGFCLWLPTPDNDCDFTKALYAHENVLVLPGQFLARHAHGLNPGEKHVRIALVAEPKVCLRGIEKVAKHLQSYR